MKYLYKYKNSNWRQWHVFPVRSSFQFTARRIEVIARHCSWPCQFKRSTALQLISSRAVNHTSEVRNVVIGDSVASAFVLFVTILRAAISRRNDMENGWKFDDKRVVAVWSCRAQRATSADWREKERASKPPDRPSSRQWTRCLPDHSASGL